MNIIFFSENKEIFSTSSDIMHILPQKGNLISIQNKLYTIFNVIFDTLTTPMEIIIRLTPLEVTPIDVTPE